MLSKTLFVDGLEFELGPNDLELRPEKHKEH